METLAEIAQPAASLLKSRGETVATVESSGGGLISAVLLAVPGASAYFLGGGAIYTAQARERLLGVTAEALAGIRPSTEPYALLLARTVRERLDTTWALAETGASGPTGNAYGDAPGHSCIAVTGPLERAITLETGAADREANMWAFTKAALGLLTEGLEQGR